MNNKKMDWKLGGQMMAILVRFFSTIQTLLRKHDIEPDILDWIEGSGREVFGQKMGEVVEAYKTQTGPKYTEKDGVIYFSLTSTGLTGSEWITRLEEKGFMLTDCAKNLLNSEDFVPTPKGTVHDMGAIRGTQFKDAERNTRNIRERAKGLKMIKAHPETACLIRELFTDAELEKMGLWYIVSMHEPIKDSDGNPSLLNSDRYGSGRYLGMFYDRPDNQWSGHGAFAFGLRK